MKKIKLLSALPLLFGLCSSAVYATSISSSEEIVGTWHLDYTKRTKDDAKTKPMDQTWEITNKTITVKGVEQMRDAAYDTSPVEYTIEGGNIKVPLLGRPGKFDMYSLEEKTETHMILKDEKYGSYSFFTKK